MPVRGLGAKNVVFSGMRRSAAAAARIVSTVDRAQQHRGVGVALRRPAAATVARVVAVGERHARRPRAARRRRSAPSRRRAARRGARRGAASSSARGHEQREPVAVDEPERRRRRASRLERGDAVGHVGAGVAHDERAAERGRAGRRRADAAEQPVDGAHAELVGGELDDQRHDRVGAGVVDARGAALARGRCTRSRSGGGRRPAPRARRRPRSVIASMRAGSSTRQSECVDAVLVGRGARRARRRPSASSAESPPASDRPQIGSRLARVARSSSRRSVLAFGSVRSWGSTPPPSSSSASAPMHAGGALRHARRRR